MLKRLLISGVAVFITLCVVSGIIAYFEHMTPYHFSEAWFPACIIFGLIAAVVTFRKVKTKNTLVEDIIINKAKIIKAEQEAKLKELNR